MRAGVVVRIRVNPKDCLSLLDVLEGSGVSVEGMSFSAISSLALSSVLEGLRKAGTIPTNDGFNYMQRMQPYVEGRSTQAKRQITERIYTNAAHGVATPVLPMGSSILPSVEEMEEETLVAEFHQKRSSHSVEDVNRVKQISAELDRRAGQ